MSRLHSQGSTVTVMLVRARARNRVGASIKRIGERAGVEISARRPRAPRRAALLAAHRIELVIDVGANRGEYARELRDHGYTGRIVSLEPSSRAFSELSARCAGDPRWEVRRLAAWDEDGTVQLGVADTFSSAMPVEPRLARLFPEAVPARVEAAPATRLDTAGLGLPDSGGTLLKLDVQGGEHRALAGATGILSQVRMIETELSVTRLYSGQPLLSDIVCLLDSQGYRLLTLDPILRDRITGEHLQFDGLFARQADTREDPARG
jgi:FkbM family methyltransferase